MTQAQDRDDLRQKIAEGKARRAAKTKALATSAADRREENEARLIDLEVEHDLTLGVDLGVVWCRSGDFVAIKKPDLLAHERYVLKCANGAVTTQDVDRYLENAILWPAKGHQEALWRAEPQAKIAACEVAQAMCEVQEKVIAGK